MFNINLIFLAEANHLTGPPTTPSTIADYFSNVAVLHMGCHNEERQAELFSALWQGNSFR